MQFKKVMAGILAAAMVVTGVPAYALGGASGVQAADEGETTEGTDETESQAVNLVEALTGVTAKDTTEGTEGSLRSSATRVSDVLVSDGYYDTYNDDYDQSITIDLGTDMAETYATAESIWIYTAYKAYSTGYNIYTCDTDSEAADDWTLVAACTDTDGDATGYRVQVVTDEKSVDSANIVASFSDTTIQRYVKFTFTAGKKNTAATGATHIAIKQLVINGVVHEATVVTPTLSVTAPAADATIASVTGDEDAKYDISTSWYPWTQLTQTAGDAMAADATFSADTSYMVQVTLTINDDDYGFSSASPATLSTTGEGSTVLDADVEVTNSGRTMTVTSYFLTDADQIVAAKQELESLYYAYGALSSSDYTTESWATLTTAATNALIVYNSNDATLEQVNAAIKSVNEALAGLEYVCTCEIGDITVTSPVTAALGTSGTATVSLSASAAIADGCHIHENPQVTYTYEVTTGLEGTDATIDGASLTVTNNDMTANQSGSITVTVTASAADEDSTATAKTATITVNVTSTKATATAIAELQAEAAKADELTQADYTESSWTTYQSALTAAQTVLNKTSPSATEVSEALSALQSAQSALKLQSEADEEAARATLDALKAQLDALNAADYTTESYNAAVDAWNDAVTIYNNETASAADLLAAAAKVEAALNSLVTTAEAEAAAKAAAQTELDAAIASAKAVIDAGQGSYTAETWSALVAAYNAATSPAASATSTDLKALLTSLTTAQTALKTQTTSGTTTTVPQKGDVVESGNFNYQVTGDDTVEVLSLTAQGKTQKKLKIYNTVSLGGKTFKVTSIAKNAFKGNKKVTSVVIGKNITTIGAKAFNGCTKLKKVTVKSKVLKSVGKAAFKKTSAKLTVKVPKAKKKAYKKLLKKGGVKASKVK